MTDRDAAGTQEQLHRMLQAIQAVGRYASRGCSGMACDRAQVAWMGNQLRVIGEAATALAPGLHSKYPDIPWDRLTALSGGDGGAVAGMSADEMQRFVERELPRVREALKHVAP